MPGEAHAKVTGFLQEATVDIVAVRVNCTETINCCKSMGHVPTAADAKVRRFSTVTVAVKMVKLHTLTTISPALSHLSAV